MGSWRFSPGRVGSSVSTASFGAAQRPRLLRRWTAKPTKMLEAAAAVLRKHQQHQEEKGEEKKEHTTCDLLL